LNTWEDALQKQPFVLALHQFRCLVFAKHMHLVEKKAEHWWRMPYVAAMGQPALA